MFKKFILVLSVLGLVLFSGCITAIPIGEFTSNENLKVRSIDYEHNKVHLGEHWYLRDYFELGNNEVRNILLTTADLEVHILLGFVSTQTEITIEVFENITYSNIGTAQNYINSNRRYNDTNSLNIYYSPTIITTGLSLGKNIIGADRSSGGSARGNNEIIFAPNSTYLVRLTNQVNQPTNINVNFDWYDHD